MISLNTLWYTLIYLILSFILGFCWHLIFFKKLYESFGNFDALHKPRFEFGILSMVLQGISLGLLYPLIADKMLLFVVIFFIWMSFVAFAELGKHQVKRIPLFLLIQTLFTLVQLGLVSIVFWYIR